MKKKEVSKYYSKALCLKVLDVLIQTNDITRAACELENPGKMEKFYKSLKHHMTSKSKGQKECEV